MAFRRHHALGLRMRYNSPRWLEKGGREGTPEEFALAYDKYPPGARLKSAERALSLLSSQTFFCHHFFLLKDGFWSLRQVNTKYYRFEFHFQKRKTYLSSPAFSFLTHCRTCRLMHFSAQSHFSLKKKKRPQSDILCGLCICAFLSSSLGSRLHLVCVPCLDLYQGHAT